MPAAASRCRASCRAWASAPGSTGWRARTASAGRVRNDGAGVTIDAFGAAAGARRLRWRGSGADAAARRRPSASSAGRPSVPEPLAGFAIVPSASRGERRPSIPADLATCPDCLARGPSTPRDRRYRYPFTNCTDCGPRFTIATRRALRPRRPPRWRRSRCARDCRREYDDPRDRRFHAQPNACPACGPRLRLCDAAGAAVALRATRSRWPRRRCAAGASSRSRGSAGSTSPATPRSNAAVARCARASAATRSRSR